MNTFLRHSIVPTVNSSKEKKIIRSHTELIEILSAKKSNSPLVNLSQAVPSS